MEKKTKNRTKMHCKNENAFNSISMSVKHLIAGIQYQKQTNKKSIRHVQSIPASLTPSLFSLTDRPTLLALTNYHEKNRSKPSLLKKTPSLSPQSTAFHFSILKPCHIPRLTAIAFTSYASLLRRPPRARQTPRTPDHASSASCSTGAEEPHQWR